VITQTRLRIPAPAVRPGAEPKRANKLATTARILALLCLTCFLGSVALAQNPGDPLYCQPQEGTTFLIVNGGAGVFTVDADCYNNNLANNTTTTITTSHGGTLTLASGGNYTYTPSTPGFVGLDTFTIPVTTVWNGAGGTGSAGGTARPGGPATLSITLNVLSSTAMLTATGGIANLIPFPVGSVTGCTVGGNAGLGPTATAVYGCVTGTATLTGATAPSHGALTTTGANVTYTPTAGYTGPDTIVYTATGVNADGSAALRSGAITATVIVNPPLDFSMTTLGVTSVLLPAGGTASFTFSVAPLSGSYSDTVTFAASGLPTGATATFSPTSIPASGGTQTVTMTVHTSSASTLLRKAPFGLKLAPFAMFLLPLFGTIRMGRQRKSLRRWLTSLLVIGILLALAALVGCGSSSGVNAKSYNVTATATSAGTQHTAAFTLIVPK